MYGKWQVNFFFIRICFNFENRLMVILFILVYKFLDEVVFKNGVFGVSEFLFIIQLCIMVILKDIIV